MDPKRSRAARAHGEGQEEGPAEAELDDGGVDGIESGPTGIAALDAALFLARQRQAAEVLVLTDGRLSLSAIQRAPHDIQLIFGVSDEKLIPYYSEAGVLAILSPGSFASGSARVQYAVFRARAASLLPPDGHIICVSSPPGSSRLNSVLDVDLAHEFEEASQVEQYLLEQGGRIDILATLLDVAIEIGRFGYEGKPVGTIFVYGAERQVLRRSRQLTFNPYHGYSERSRNVTLPDVRESLKIFARMDGAIIVEGDGTVVAAGRYLLVPPGDTHIVKGLGTRHQAAAFMSKETGALVIVVSETAGRVTLFSKGKPIFSLSPRSVR